MEEVLHTADLQVWSYLSADLVDAKNVVKNMVRSCIRNTSSFAKCRNGSGWLEVSLKEASIMFSLFVLSFPEFGSYWTDTVLSCEDLWYDPVSVLVFLLWVGDYKTWNPVHQFFFLYFSVSFSVSRNCEVEFILECCGKFFFFFSFFKETLNKTVNNLAFSRQRITPSWII